MIVAFAAMVTALSLTALAVGLYAFYQAQKLFHSARITTGEVREECAAAIEGANAKCSAIESELQLSKLQTPVEILPGPPEPA